MKTRMVHIRIPDKIVEELDRIAEEKNFGNRNELIRDSLRNVVEQHSNSGE